MKKLIKNVISGKEEYVDMTQEEIDAYPQLDISAVSVDLNDVDKLIKYAKTQGWI